MTRPSFVPGAPASSVSDVGASESAYSAVSSEEVIQERGPYPASESRASDGTAERAAIFVRECAERELRRVMPKGYDRSCVKCGRAMFTWRGAAYEDTCLTCLGALP